MHFYLGNLKERKTVIEFHLETAMKVVKFLTAFFMAFFCFLGSAQAANPAHLTQLQSTRSCVGCDLRGADLSGVDLRGVNLTHANLSSADLTEAKMIAVNLNGADLRKANLSRADLLAADLTGANFKGAKVRSVDLNTARICRTIDPLGKTVHRDC
jgi:uncharacterized protein YjbI with pentapeptide repeats